MKVARKCVLTVGLTACLGVVWYSLLVSWRAVKKSPTSSVENQVGNEVMLLGNGTLGNSNATCPADVIGEPSKRLKELSKLSEARSVRFDIPADKVYTEHVVILTPVSNAAAHIPHFFENLCTLTYPHHLISIALAEDSSRDNTYSLAVKYLEKIQKYFAKVRLFTLKESLPFMPIQARHDMGWQFTRRSHLAKSRNTLVSQGLDNETWVLWMDSDVAYIPPDLIQQLLAAEKDVVVPSCMYRASSDKVDDFDRNTWKDTQQARDYLKDKGDKFLMLEGYGPPMRLFLSKLKGTGNIVEIDGVGGCVLLIRADLHRKGLFFPPYVYKNHIETEGLAKMVQDMGFKLYGLPNLEVYHN